MNPEKIIQIAIKEEKMIALTDKGNIYERSMYRNTKNEWSKAELPNLI